LPSWHAALSRADPVLGTARDGSPALRGPILATPNRRCARPFPSLR
jgi:hypothetical protein